jgi:hypothetical protein
MGIAAEAVQLKATEIKQLCKDAAEAQGSLQMARSEVKLHGAFLRVISTRHAKPHHHRYHCLFQILG